MGISRIRLDSNLEGGKDREKPILPHFVSRKLLFVQTRYRLHVNSVTWRGLFGTMGNGAENLVKPGICYIWPSMEHV